MSNFYPSQLKEIIAYIESLDEAEKKISDATSPTIFPREIRLTNADGDDFGILEDEIGGAWSWRPA